MVATLHANGDQFSYLCKVKRDRWVRSKCQEGLNAFELTCSFGKELTYCTRTHAQDNSYVTRQ
jgi:hypothetical protein